MFTKLCELHTLWRHDSIVLQGGIKKAKKSYYYTITEKWHGCTFKKQFCILVKLFIIPTWLFLHWLLWWKFVFWSKTRTCLASCILSVRNICYSKQNKSAFLVYNDDFSFNIKMFRENLVKEGKFCWMLFFYSAEI